jgi:hypothetical protein
MDRHVPSKRRKDHHYAERITIMTTAETAIPENAATLGQQGAHVAPEKGSSKKGATQKMGPPKGQVPANEV